MSEYYGSLFRHNILSGRTHLQGTHLFLPQKELYRVYSQNIGAAELNEDSIFEAERSQGIGDKERAERVYGVAS